jgi:mRNA interferase MazF
MNEPHPCRGQIWWVDFDPTRGSETSKTRPAVVVSSDSTSRLPVRLVVPLTEWKEKHREYIWRLQVKPSQLNGLSKDSAADALQVRCVSLERFGKHVGRLEAPLMPELCAAIALVVEYE